MSWDRWRAEFPVTEHVVHLNHAGLSPLSRWVVDAVTTFLREALLLDPDSEPLWNQRSEDARRAFAGLVGARADEVAFVKNTAEGLSLLAAGLTWGSGDNVIAVDGEYPSNVYPWIGLRRWGVETRLVQPRRGRAEVDAIRALADAHTRLVSVSFVDWQSGARTDLGAIGSFCRERGILFCVDGIQGVGAIRLDLERDAIDCLAVGGHKWLLAPEGCGCLVVSRRVIDRVDSVLHGWKSVRDADTYLPYHFDPRPDAAKFEPGSPPQLGIQALGAALGLLHEIGPQRVEQRVFEITDHLADGLRARGAEIVSPWAPHERSGIVVFRLGTDPDGLCAEALRQRIVVRVRNGGIRVAPHFYNNEDDIDRLLAVVDAWTKGK